LTVSSPLIAAHTVAPLQLASLRPAAATHAELSCRQSAVQPVPLAATCSLLGSPVALTAAPRSE